MDSLFVLHRSPRFGVQLLADIHLRPSLKAAVKIASSAVVKQAPEELSIEKSMDGIKEYKYDGHILVPPFPKENAWVDWVCESQQHFWWMVEMAWHCDKELTYRFDHPQSKEYVLFSRIIEKGAARHFPKSESATIRRWPWPASGSLASDSNDETESELALHKESYRELVGIKMEWTKRNIPDFFSKGQSTLLCPECGAVPPQSGLVCDTSCYYGRN